MGWERSDSQLRDAQPIISYNYGVNNKERIKQSLVVAIKAGIFCGLLFTIISALFSSQITTMFISNENVVHSITSKGLPLFAMGFIPFAINIVAVGYFQSI